MTELSDHLQDLETEALELGLSTEQARSKAIDQLGDMNTIAEEVLRRPELRCWFYRLPRLARLVLPVAYCLLLPAVPIYASVAHGTTIGRWCAGLIMSGLLTSGMLLVLYAAIILT
ncbi:MAG: permease prefix domain 1-containing protein [Woeseiaceae bacterium]|nr:permease prefix domain 1-containing protein [Woeseiaceae bacterium]